MFILCWHRVFSCVLLCSVVVVFMLCFIVVVVFFVCVVCLVVFLPFGWYSLCYVFLFPVLTIYSLFFLVFPPVLVDWLAQYVPCTLTTIFMHLYFLYFSLFSPLLTWRDAQHLLVHSSHLDYLSDAHWQVNGAGFKVSHWYGFGIINGEALVNRARNWITVPPQNKCTLNVTSKLGTGEVATSDNSLVLKMHVENCKLSALEHVQAITTLRIRHGMRKDISLILTSPAGTRAVLLPFRQYDRHKDGFHLWPFMSVQSWGERANGDWVFTVRLKDESQVELESLELLLYGTDEIPSSVQAIPSTCHSQCVRGCAREGAQFCDSCKHFRIAHSLECVERCPDETYQSGNICRACLPLCSKCSDSHVCSGCLPSAHLLTNGTCLSECPAGHFATASRTCLPCHPSCLSCNGSHDTECTSCQPEFILLKHTCVVRGPASCTIREYYDRRAHQCLPCHRTCASCSGRYDNQCSSCDKNSQLSADRMCIDYRHARSCNHAQYLDLSNFECVDCPHLCTNCSDNVTCLACHDGYFLTQGGDCVSKCPDSTATETDSRLCREMCHSSCSTCSEGHCTSCQPGQLLVEEQCLDECPPNFYKHLGSCLQCHAQCTSCDGPLENHCLSCSSGTFLLSHTCVKNCPTGTFGAQNMCLNCIENCSNCSAEDSCNQCSDHHYLLSSSPPACTETCPATYFRNSGTRMCQKCLSNCEKCDSSTICHNCKKGFFYHASQRSCVRLCPEGYFTSDKTCALCQFPCSTCSGSAVNCSSCSNRMALNQTSHECMMCCSPDVLSEQKCCECARGNRYCHQLSTPGTSQTTTTQMSAMSQLIAGSAVFLLLILLIAIAILNILLRPKCHRTSVNYHVLSSEDFGLEQQNIKSETR